jgi:GNAT superfamily N-acetyltransferase/ketosteroid isomerase-like protein
VRNVAVIRPCREEERGAVLAIVNAAAEAYRGVIPADRWHEPYMPADELDAEIATGVEFWVYEDGGELVGVMGIQQVQDVHLIRHAYVLPDRQGRGIGGELIKELVASRGGPLLVGTWAAAEWAIRFYERHGFELAPPEVKSELLRTYWSIPERQIDTSVVLTRPSFIEVELQRGYAAFSRGDFEEAARRFHPDIVVVPSGGQSPIEGLDSVRRWFEPDAFEQQQSEIVEFTPAGDKILVRLRSRIVGAGSGIELDFHSWAVFTFDEAGLVTRIQLFFDHEEAVARKAAGLA